VEIFGADIFGADIFGADIFGVEVLGVEVLVAEVLGVDIFDSELARALVLFAALVSGIAFCNRGTSASPDSAQVRLNLPIAEMLCRSEIRATSSTAIWFAASCSESSSLAERVMTCCERIAKSCHVPR